MPISKTPHYQLSVVGSGETEVKFLPWRTAVDGTQDTSNFMVLDTLLFNINNEIDKLKTSSILLYVPATHTIENQYTAEVNGIDSYINNMILTLSLDGENTSTCTLNINSLGDIYIKKYNRLGELIDIEAKDLKPNYNYLLRYNGTYFILLSTVNVDNLKINGTVGNVLTISPEYNIIDSGKNLDNYVEKEVGKVLSSNDFTNENVEMLTNAYNTSSSNSTAISELTNNKVDKELGKGLYPTTGVEFTQEEKDKLVILEDHKEDIRILQTELHKLNENVKSMKVVSALPDVSMQEPNTIYFVIGG